MPWQVSISLYLLISSVRSIQNRRLGLYKMDVSLYTLVASYVCVLAGGFVFALLTNGRVEHEMARSLWPFIVLGGIIFSIISLLVIKIYRYLPASVAIFMSLCNTLVVLIMASIFANESLNFKQFIGALLLFATVILVTIVSRRNNKSKARDRSIVIGVALSLIVALLFGPAILNEKYIIDQVGLETYMIYGWGAQAVGAFILAYFFRNKDRRLKDLKPKIHLNIWIYGVLLLFSGMTFIYSLKHSGSSSITVISSSATLALTVLFSFIFLKERSNMILKLCGIVMSCTGLLLIFS